METISILLFGYVSFNTCLVLLALLEDIQPNTKFYSMLILFGFPLALFFIIEDFAMKLYKKHKGDN
jgi:hypothetical protein